MIAMAANPLSIRSFGGIVKSRMSKAARIKKYDTDKACFTLSADALEHDATKQEVFYGMLFESLIFYLHESDEYRFPDIGKRWISETLNGRIPLNSEILKAAQRKEAILFIGEYFANNIVPNIPDKSLSMVVDNIDMLVQEDNALGKKIHKSNFELNFRLFPLIQ